MRARISQKILEVTKLNVLNRIHAVAIEVQGVYIPHAPVFNFIGNILIIEVNILTHQKVIVAILRIYFPIPIFSGKFIYGFLLGVLVPAHTIKVLPSVLEGRIFIVSARKIILSISFNIVVPGYLLVSVASVYFYRGAFLSTIGAHSVTNNDVPVNLNIVIMK
ncbi:hypothetical protein D3C74_280280 [compost metagenome]